MASKRASAVKSINTEMILRNAQGRIVGRLAVEPDRILYADKEQKKWRTVPMARFREFMLAPENRRVKATRAST